MRLLWSTEREKSLGAVANGLRTYAKPFGEVTMSDLVAPNEAGANGLYFFTNGHGQWMYVGRSGSRALIERVPSHLDARSGAWFGTLLKRLAMLREPPSSPSQCVEEALGLKVALLFADMPGVDLATAEDAFRHGLAPVLNSPKKPRAVDLDQTTLDDVS